MNVNIKKREVKKSSFSQLGERKIQNQASVQELRLKFLERIEKLRIKFLEFILVF